jgi:hypothetical protein
MFPGLKKKAEEMRLTRIAERRRSQQMAEELQEVVGTTGELPLSIDHRAKLLDNLLVAGSDSACD